MSVKRKTADNFYPEILKLFDKYVHDDISRRDFLQSVTQFAVGVSAMGLLDALNPRFAEAQQIARKLPEGNGKVGVVGFCYGGGIANLLATRLPDLNAVVSFYGGQPLDEDAAKIRAPLLLHYAEKDARSTGGWPKYEAVLKAAGVNYQAFVYQGVQHGLTTTPHRATMKQLQSWRGKARSTFLMTICAAAHEMIYV